MVKTRLENLRTKLASNNLDAFLVSKTQNRYFLTGWQGDDESGYLLITASDAFIFTDSRYTEEVSQKIPGFTLTEAGSNFPQVFAHVARSKKLSRIGFEDRDLSVYFFEKIRSEARNVELVPLDYEIEEIRSLKDSTEIALIKTSCDIAARSFEFIKKEIKLGMTEAEVALKMERFMREAGAEKNAWDPFIVASGPNSSMVHYGAGERKIQKGDQVQLDWGCVYKGYYCDISRVLFMGTPTAKQVQVYDLVLQAQKEAFLRVKLGKQTKEIDLAARNYLKEKTDFSFGHSIGHGVGLEIHELPRVNNISETLVTEGQVFTVEPGIYEPGWGGVRLEDTILVTNSGYKVLTDSPKEISNVIVKG